MINLRRYLLFSLADENNSIYYSSANEIEKQTIYDICVNEMYNENFYIKLNSWGDFQISIYKIAKPNNIIELFMDNEEELTNQNIEIIIHPNRKINNNEIKKLNFKLFCETFGKPVIFTKEQTYYDNDKFSYLYKNIWYTTPLKDNNFKDIKPYKIIFGKIFDKSYDDVLRHKCAHYDGNFITQIIEFNDVYYLIDMNSS